MEALVGTDEQDKQDTENWLKSSFTIYQLNQNIIDLTINIRKYRTPKLKLPDAIILATSKYYKIPLFTRNTKDFKDDDIDIILPYIK